MSTESIPKVISTSVSLGTSVTCPYCEQGFVMLADSKISPTAIYDFAGWLTTRKAVLTIGSSQDVAPLADAVGEYLKLYPERFNV